MTAAFDFAADKFAGYGVELQFAAAARSGCDADLQFSVARRVVDSAAAEFAAGGEFVRRAAADWSVAAALAEPAVGVDAADKLAVADVGEEFAAAVPNDSEPAESAGCAEPHFFPARPVFELFPCAHFVSWNCVSAR